MKGYTTFIRKIVSELSKKNPKKHLGLVVQSIVNLSSLGGQLIKYFTTL